jgi:uncharacterized protein (DUF2235 family)
MKGRQSLGDSAVSKNIVVCCDGTANEFAQHNTNVVKLYSTLLDDPARQVTYYHPGLGTMEPAGALTTFTRKTAKMLGMAIGYGLGYDIRDAYVFVTNNFRPDDRLFLFGFSRGAYTVRAVASLLHMYGLIRPGNEPLVPYAIRMMMGIERGRGRSTDLNAYFDLAHQFKTSMSAADCRPWFVGVWDTVSSVGWMENPLKLPYVANNPSIEIGRHAIAIDERRAFFRNHLWRPPSRTDQERGPKDLKQVWFPGVHCDVGGGYPEAESGLSKVALEWMLDEAQSAGLMVDPARRREILGQDGGRYVAPNPLADPHESLTGAWHLAEYVPKKHFDWQSRTEKRRMNRHRRRTIPPGSLVHVAARQRGEAYWRQRLPDNPVWVDNRAPADLEPATEHRT